MDHIEAERRYRRLVAAVAETRDMLVSLGEHHWGHWMDAVDRELAADDARGLARLVDACAGMGSFSDLVIHPVNGHRVEAERVNDVNDKLGNLRSRMYEDASTLLHDLKS